MKRVAIVVLGMTLGFGAAHAADDNSSGLFDSLRKKIEQLTPKKKLQTTNAVGGVRGAQADADELYWKGEKKEQSIDADELAAFEEALNQAEAGNKTGAEKMLKDFLKKYPQSQLKPDAEQALALLKNPPVKPAQTTQAAQANQPAQTAQPDQAAQPAPAAKP
jgi:hypothetical protein